MTYFAVSRPCMTAGIGKAPSRRPSALPLGKRFHRPSVIAPVGHGVKQILIERSNQLDRPNPRKCRSGVFDGVNARSGGVMRGRKKQRWMCLTIDGGIRGTSSRHRHRRFVKEYSGSRGDPRRRRSPARNHRATGCRGSCPKCRVPERNGGPRRLTPVLEKVKPFLHWQKNDIDDAAAIVEAAHRPTMRFVAATSEAAQGVAVLCSTAASQRAIAINAVIAEARHGNDPDWPPAGARTRSPRRLSGRLPGPQAERFAAAGESGRHIENVMKRRTRPGLCGCRNRLTLAPNARISDSSRFRTGRYRPGLSACTCTASPGWRRHHGRAFHQRP